MPEGAFLLKLQATLYSSRSKVQNLKDDTLAQRSSDVCSQRSKMQGPLPKNASKSRINLVIDGLSYRFVQIYSGESPGGIDAIFQANSFQSLVKTLVSSTPLDN